MWGILCLFRNTCRFRIASFQINVCRSVFCSPKRHKQFHCIRSAPEKQSKTFDAVNVRRSVQLIGSFCLNRGTKHFPYFGSTCLPFINHFVRKNVIAFKCTNWLKIVSNSCVFYDFCTLLRLAGPTTTVEACLVLWREKRAWKSGMISTCALFHRMQDFRDCFSLNRMWIFVPYFIRNIRQKLNIAMVLLEVMHLSSCPFDVMVMLSYSLGRNGLRGILSWKKWAFFLDSWKFQKLKFN